MGVDRIKVVSGRSDMPAAMNAMAEEVKS